MISLPLQLFYDKTIFNTVSTRSQLDLEFGFTAYACIIQEVMMNEGKDLINNIEQTDCLVKCLNTTTVMLMFCFVQLQEAI